MSRRIAIYSAALYLLVGIVTFGHCAAEAPKPGCAIIDSADKKTCLLTEIDVRPAAGLAAALAWPLYWSWEAWS